MRDILCVCVARRADKQTEFHFISCHRSHKNERIKIRHFRVVVLVSKDFYVLYMHCICIIIIIVIRKRLVQMM